MDPVKKAIEMINELPLKKLEAALKLLEILKDADNAKLDEIIYKAWEASLDEDELTPEEKEQLTRAEAEIKAGLGIKAEDVWRELDLSDDNPNPKD